MFNIFQNEIRALSLALATGALLCHSTVVQAQTTFSQASSAQHRMLVSEMMKSNVTGAADKKVGEIKDLVIDLTSGQVRYAILEFDPGFFKSEKLFAIPANALNIHANGKGLTYREVSQSQMKHAALEKSDWVRAVDNKRYLAVMDQNYGFKPPAGTTHSMRASNIIGRDVNSRGGKNIGKIKDLVIDLSNGNVKFAVFSFDPSWFSSKKLFAFPITSFRVEDDTDELMLDVDKNMLASMKNFDADEWGSLNDLNRDNFVNEAPHSAPAK